MKIDYDLENSPLEIRTNSATGSGDKLNLDFYNNQNKIAGGFIVDFWSSPKYELYYCTSSSTNFPVDLPSDDDKVWKINLDRTSGVARVVIHCNGMEVLNVEPSEKTCDLTSWSNVWSRDVEKIEFNIFVGTASDFYRPG